MIGRILVIFFKIYLKCIGARKVKDAYCIGDLILCDIFKKVILKRKAREVFVINICSDYTIVQYNIRILNLVKIIKELGLAKKFILGEINNGKD